MGRTRYSASTHEFEIPMKRLVIALTLLALAGCIPIGFKAQTQLIVPSVALPASRTEVPSPQPSPASGRGLG